MNTPNRELLADIALHLPGAACVGFGAASVMTGHPAGNEISNIGIAYIGLLLSYQHIVGKRRHLADERADDAAHHASILHADPLSVGSIVSIAFLRENLAADRAAMIGQTLETIPHVALLTDHDRRELGYPDATAVFATTHSVIALDADPDGNIPDLVVASANGATLTNDANREIPFVKIAAIRVSVLLGQYPDRESADAVWNRVYHESRGERALLDAYRTAGSTAGAMIADGPLAFHSRDGTVLPYHDYRYISFDAISDVQTHLQAHGIVDTIVQRGVYDVDRKHFVALPQRQRERLADAIYDRGRDYWRERSAVGLER